MSAPFQHEKTIALAAVTEAAALTSAVQQDIASSVIEKQDRSPVTIADFGSQALVCRMIRAAFPDDPIVAEEDAALLREADYRSQRDAVVRRVQLLHPEATENDVLQWIDYGNAQHYHDRFWTLDPIDGTKGFLRGEQYAIALALIVNGEVCVAALACPNLQDSESNSQGSVYSAVKGQGTMRIPIGASDMQSPVHASRQEDPAEARFCESVESGHSSHSDAAAIAEHLGIHTDPVRLDSQAKYAVVAQGQAEIYLRLPTSRGEKVYVEKIWDHAAGSLVITEAGGQVTDLHGQALDFSRGPLLERNQGIIATNGVLHEEVLAAVEATGLVEMP